MDPPDVVDHPAKVNPERVNVFEVRPRAVFACWTDIDPLPPLAMNVTVVGLT